MRTRGPSGGRRPLIVRSIAAAVGLLFVIPATAALASAEGGASVPASVAAPRPETQRSTTTTTTPPPPLTEPVTTAAPTTAAPTTTTTAVPSTTTGLGRGASESDEASDRLNLVVILLFVLAGIIAVATVLFWRFTRPSRAVAPAAAMHWEDGTGEHPIAPALPGQALPSADPALPSVDQAPASFTTTPRTSPDPAVPVATVAASPVFQHHADPVASEPVRFEPGPSEPVRPEPARAEAAGAQPVRAVTPLDPGAADDPTHAVSASTSASASASATASVPAPERRPDPDDAADPFLTRAQAVPVVRATPSRSVDGEGRVNPFPASSRGSDPAPVDPIEPPPVARPAFDQKGARPGFAPVEDERLGVRLIESDPEADADDGGSSEGRDRGASQWASQGWGRDPSSGSADQ